MNRFKLLSVILAVLLAGYCAVSVALFGQLHDEIDRAESRCRLLESERDELAEQTADVRQDVDTQPSSMNGTLAQLRETLEFREMEVADLSKAYESLQADYDALQEKLTQMPGADLPPEAIERVRRFRERFAEGDFSPEEMQRRRQGRVQGLLDMLQERMNNAPDENIRRNLLQIADSVGTIDELRRQMRQAADDEVRRATMSALREEDANLQHLVREERNLELAQVAKQFGINDPENVRKFVDAVETVNSSSLEQLSRPRGMLFGGRGGRPGRGRR